jgi:hypothetical protein
MDFWGFFCIRKVYEFYCGKLEDRLLAAVITLHELALLFKLNNIDHSDNLTTKCSLCEAGGPFRTLACILVLLFTLPHIQFL